MFLHYSIFLGSSVHDFLPSSLCGWLYFKRIFLSSLSEVLSSKWSRLLGMLFIEFVLWFIYSFISQISAWYFFTISNSLLMCFSFPVFFFDFTPYTILHKSVWLCTFYAPSLAFPLMCWLFQQIVPSLLTQLSVLCFSQNSTVYSECLSDQIIIRTSYFLRHYQEACERLSQRWC